MKLLRILLIAAGVVALLVVIAGVLVFTPSVQTWAARKALGSQPGMTASIGSVNAGLNNVTLEAVRIQKSGVLLSLPSASVDLSVLSAARKQVLIKRLVAKGWTLDLTAQASSNAVAPGSSSSVVATASPTSSPSRPTSSITPSLPRSAQSFEGIFRSLELPVDLQLDSAELEGTVIFAGATGQPPSRMEVVITGGQVKAKQAGQLRLRATAKVHGSDGQVTDVQGDGVVQLKMETPRTIDSLAANLDLGATGPQVPNGAKLLAEVKAVRGAKEETYALSLRSGPTGRSKQLVDLQASFPYEAQVLSGTWTVDAAESDIAPFALGFALPVFAAQGKGQFRADRDFRQVHASGLLDATVDKLERVSDALQPLGRLQTRADFDVVQQGDAIRVDRLTVELNGADPLLSVRALQSIELNLKTRQLKVSDPAKDLLQGELKGIPLAWAEGFMPPGLAVQGDAVRGQFVARAEESGLRVRSLTPLTIGGLTVVNAGQALLQGVDLAVRFAGDYSPEGWQAEVSELALSSAGARWLTASLRTGQPGAADQPLKATGQYQIDLPVALRQPVLGQGRALTKGVVAGDFTAVVSPALKQIAAKLDVRDLASAAAKAPLPSVSLTLRADVQTDGLIKLQAPVVVQGKDRKSDLLATAELRTSGDQRTIDAQLTSSLLYVEDVQILAAPLQAGTVPAQPSAPVNKPSTRGNNPTPAPTGRDAKPFWAGTTGQLRISLKKVVYSPDVQAGDVEGVVKITPDALTFDNIRAAMGEGSGAKVNGGVTFKANASEPYVLNGDVNVSNLNPGPILALLSPERQPTVEGQFDLVGKFSGTAARADALANQTSADIRLTSRGGKFHGFAASALATDVGKYQKTASTVSSIIGLAAGMMGRSDVANYAEKGRAFSDVIRRFAEIDFDQLNLVLTHRPGEATKVSDFSLTSPELRMVGNGAMEDKPDLGWLKRPLRLDMQMSVRGEQAKDLQILGALKETQDSLGYVPLRERFALEGTLSGLVSQSLFKFLGGLMTGSGEAKPEQPGSAPSGDSR